MADTTNLSIRIDRGLKDEADSIFNDMGMNLTTAITIFIKQAVRQKKIPFEIALDSNNNEKGISLFEVVAASERIWDNAVRTGMADMSMEDIDSEIKASRKERKARRAAP